MSPKFSPKMRKALIGGNGNASVNGLVEISPAADKVVLRQQLEKAGARIEAWSEQGRTVSITIPAGRLLELDALDDVVYVETSGRYGY